MRINLWNRTTKLSLLLFAIVSCLSFWGWQFALLSNIAWIVIVAVTLILSWRKLEYGVYILTGELVIGSFGHLFALQIADFTVSIRIGLFAAVLTASIYWLVKHAFWSQINWKKYTWVLVLTVFVILGTVQGLIKFDIQTVYSDMNAYLYFLLLPAFALTVKKGLHTIINIILAGANWLFVQTYILLYIFTHKIGWLDTELLYNWVRDVRLGEITHVSGNFYRVFMQSQLYSLIAFIIVWIILLWAAEYKLKLQSKWYLYVTALTASLTLMASFSRSFWVGLLVGGLSLVIYLLITRIINYKKVFISVAGVIAVFVIASGLMLTWANYWQPELVSSRVSDSQESAASSRITQLGPLWYQIQQQPLLGNGFGQSVTYYSHDPRIKNDANPQGRYTTTAFEWGYLDIWLKIGLFGLLAYLAIMGRIVYKNAKYSQNKPQRALFAVGLTCGLIAVAGIHIFSPYLNHPLGIGYLLLTLSYDI